MVGDFILGKTFFWVFVCVRECLGVGQWVKSCMPCVCVCVSACARTFFSPTHYYLARAGWFDGARLSLTHSVSEEIHQGTPDILDDDCSSWSKNSKFSNKNNKKRKSFRASLFCEEDSQHHSSFGHWLCFIGKLFYSVWNQERVCERDCELWQTDRKWGFPDLQQQQLTGSTSVNPQVKKQQQKHKMQS